ncbi:family 1 glycosylhydrolase [Microvirga mediterraneensis]|uniref:dTDP-4-dehydrorhamnose reductase n=1 Tax=Microvirga mediterraneensis TaxID=2754695 RepID=A0A838BI86_9HYPH|nr:family 1 glycosylhydrolase [Microvirga mediterraneensis]MBA1154905.1 sugar nucleotide-binding protein [Microvirga mediterraneensis]
MNRPLELWGGLECTVARIGDDYRDQNLETGHHDRIADLDRIAELGIRTLRYPVLWERISPESPDRTDFSWHDERLTHLRKLDIRAIAGLCHHGSGPHYTYMLDPAWPELLARHAANVARRYPHLELYTPVNEPLTTARFSGLYGHWYPHGTNYEAFLKILVNECKATVLSMREIRKIRPDAQLVQTDDMGKTFSTPALAYQAEHENQRRFLGFDLLCGMVDRNHPWWRIFLDNGVAQADLELFLEADAAPDIIGINHYLTSERYLDERMARYPEHHWGGNGRHRYADAEAVRMPLPSSDLGPAARLREVWERYRRPIAVTEVHHGSSRDDQLRWLMEVWNDVNTLRDEGADIRAVTIWSLYGAVDWNSLLTRRDAFYEPGPFDVRAPRPRRTALAHAAQALATTGTFDHPVLDRAGWWKRDIRFYKPPARQSKSCWLADVPRQLLITGATGTLGRAYSRLCDFRGLNHVLLSRQDMDIADPKSVAEALACHRPWAVINTAGYVRVVEAENDRQACFRENATGAEVLARACADLDIPLVTFSSDLVFDGTLGRPYVESDEVNPTTVYGESKAEAERRVLAAHDKALVLRTSAFFSPWDRYNFVWSILNALSKGEGVKASLDVVSPTYVPDLVNTSLDLLIDGGTGIWHMANIGETSWRHLAVMAAERAGFDPGLVMDTGDLPALNTALFTERGILMPRLDGALDRFFIDSEVEWSDDAMKIAAE